MAYIIGSLMAGLSFLVNKLLLRFIGSQSVITYSPIFEEMAKTLCSYYLNADILVTHVVFGSLEAGYDWFTSSSSERGSLAALLSIVGHTLFGLVTVAVLSASNSIIGAIFLGVCLHLIWNVIFIRFFS